MNPEEVESVLIDGMNPEEEETEEEAVSVPIDVMTLRRRNPSQWTS
jgi:hypothetical protein